MVKKRVIPHHSRMFLYRQGLKMIPSQNFIDKFVEFYNELLPKSKIRQNVPPIDEKTAIFFINSLIEAIIYCLDFGYDVWLKRVMVFVQKVTDYRHNIKSHINYTVENVKKIRISPILSVTKQIKKNINKDNEIYQQYLEQKSENYEKIKQYYREFYDEEHWWK